MSRWSIAPARSDPGALPLETMPSAAIAMRPAGKTSGRVVEDLAARFRALPLPVIGRIADGALIFDLRCLDDEATLADMLPRIGRRDGTA